MRRKIMILAVSSGIALGAAIGIAQPATAAQGGVGVNGGSAQGGLGINGGAGGNGGN